LSGCATSSNSPRLAEVAARLGFDVVWTEMEHASSDLAGAESICLAIEAGGAIPAVRTAGTRREQVMHALEIGARIVIIPMVNDAATARELVQYGKFPPLGQRGYNTRSRGVGYGLVSPPDFIREANVRTALLPQIETLQAVANLDAILEVKGLGGIFIGPGDLSAALGCPGDFQNPELIRIACECIGKTRSAGLHASLLVAPGPLLRAALEAGADLCFFANDIGAAIAVWREQLKTWKKG